MSSSPFTSPRLFENPILERLSRVRPWFPIAFWGPVVAIALHFHLAAGFGLAEGLAVFAAGFVVWTFVEYGLHRELFHWRPDASLGRRFVYLLHGVHHEFPNDPDRLLMPPAAAIPFAAAFALFFRAILGPGMFPGFFAGFLTGYLVYDYFHYASHFSDRFAEWFPSQKRRHMVHHFVDEERAFGVSSPFWDRVFGTE